MPWEAWKDQAPPGSPESSAWWPEQQSSWIQDGIWGWEYSKIPYLKHRDIVGLTWGKKKSYPQCSQKTSMRLSTSMSGCGDPVFRDWTKAIPLSTDPQLHWRRAISQNPERNTQGIAWLEKQRSHTFSISTAPRKIWAHGIIIIYFMTHTGAQCLDEIHQSWNMFAQDRCCKWTAYWIPN